MPSLRVLVVGSSGSIGLPLTLSLARAGHTVFALARPQSQNKPEYVKLQAAGVQLVDGDLSDAARVLEVFRELEPVEAVVSAVGAEQVYDQRNLITAMQRSATVTRFIPSEYSVDLNSAEASVPDVFEPRRQILQEVRSAGIPYTVIASNGFMEDWFAGTSLQQHLAAFNCFESRSVNCLSGICSAC